jgi:glycosyltransferase involved in cell wall biosynthesis
MTPAVAPDQVAAVLSSAHCALVAIQPTCLSYRYSLPNKLFEAVQAGVPVVATNLPDVASVVNDYGLGTLFRAGSVEELAAAVTRVLCDGRAARAGVARAAADLCWEVEVRRLLSCYRTVGHSW